MAREIFIKVRATDRERNDWNRIAASRGLSLSKMLRLYMDRAVKRENSVKQEAAE